MRIRVAYYGQSRLITGKEEELFEVFHKMSVEDIIRKLAEEYGEQLGGLLLTETGVPRKSVIFAVNDETVEPAEYGALRDNDLFSILPAVSGG